MIRFPSSPLHASYIFNLLRTLVHWEMFALASMCVLVICSIMLIDAWIL